MGKRNCLVFAQLSVLYLGVLYLVSLRGRLPLLDSDDSQYSASVSKYQYSVDHGQSATSSTSALREPTLSTSQNTPPDIQGEDANQLARWAKAASMIPSILDPSDTSIDRMSCPPINTSRYGHLRSRNNAVPTTQEKQYFFALNLRQCVDLLPRLLGSIVEALRFLGPENCALSIVEGNSDDGTLEVLRLLVDELQAMGVEYWLASSTLDPSTGLRIRKLAKLRAMAVEPVTGPAEILQKPEPGAGVDEIGTRTYFSRPPIAKLPLAPDATILFINDVAACAEDILELAHQRIFQAADMVCAMDWTNPPPSSHPSNSTTTTTTTQTTPPSPPTSSSPPPIFYDVWIARSLTGNLLFDIPPLTTSWHLAPNLFFDNPATQRARFAAGQPTQVFSCWNGAVALAAGPLARGEVAFRWPRVGECYQGEPQLLCKDLWWRGRGRIAVVPAVNLGYGDGMGRWVKGERGFVTDYLQGRRWDGGGGEGVVEERIAWEEWPPEMVKCVPTFTEQRWLPWNESLV